ncbi:Metallo-dependent phosphatase-like protein [Gongronella butleri]|nr:Metallo-dependent phosphatase-like protein [Gongronella butleri]
MVVLTANGWLLAACSMAAMAQASPLQSVLQKNLPTLIDREPAQYGRFLHLTDIHLDDYYQEGATIKSYCHRVPKKKKKKRKTALAGHWGAPGTECDAAPAMVYHSIEAIANEWRDKIDFIVWTGDNARHDTEPGKIRRSGWEILQYNVRMTEFLQQHFRRSSDNSSIPLVPCLGNNDVHPHNMLAGPMVRPGTRDLVDDNLQLIIYRNFWLGLIPDSQHDAFRRGGYFAVDVARGIRVLSLNTLYFFDSNTAVGNCMDEGQPGWDHVDWMRSQLEQARADDVKVYLMGHVPPSERTFKPDCLDIYTRLSVEYRDIIQGHFYGHANADHFQLLSTDSLSGHDDDPWMETRKRDEIVSISESPNRLAERLRDQYKQLAHKGGNDDNLVVVHVAPPLLPLYNPTFRVNEYNKDHDSPQFGMWTKYTQWYVDVAVWNEAYDNGNTSKPVFQQEYATDTAYDMTDLSAKSWIQLARQLTERTAAARSLWTLYLTNMVVQQDASLDEDLFLLD